MSREDDLGWRWNDRARTLDDLDRVGVLIRLTLQEVAHSYERQTCLSVVGSGSAEFEPSWGGALMMGSSERPAAMRRARELQMTIHAATARAVAAQRRVRRAVAARDQAIERCDERIAMAKGISKGRPRSWQPSVVQPMWQPRSSGSPGVKVRRAMKAQRGRLSLAGQIGSSASCQTGVTLSLYGTSTKLRLT